MGEARERLSFLYPKIEPPGPTRRQTGQGGTPLFIGILHSVEGRGINVLVAWASHRPQGFYPPPQTTRGTTVPHVTLLFVSRGLGMR